MMVSPDNRATFIAQVANKWRSRLTVSQADRRVLDAQIALSSAQHRLRLSQFDREVAQADERIDRAERTRRNAIEREIEYHRQVADIRTAATAQELDEAREALLSRARSYQG